MQGPPTIHPSEPTKARPSAGLSARRLSAGLGLVVLIAAAAYVATRPLGGSPTASDPEAGASPGGAGQGVAIGRSAPDFVRASDQEPLLLDLEDRPIHLSDFAGRPLWIVFWATWCTPCQQEASGIRASFHAHRADGLEVLAIDVQEPAVAVRDYALSHDLDYAIGLDATAGVKALYGSLGLPSHFFLDGDSVIRDRYIGQLTADLMEQHLRSIVGP
jgi:cytochrome c biogenesis protein CcmG/thiol:disulfide interchange protein DsbE